MRLGFTGLFAGLFLLTSCTPKQADQVISSADSQAIIGGGYIEASDPIAHSTVQLIRFEDGRSRTGPRTSCSASIISDTIILTAAHCMDHAYKSTADVSGLWVYFSNKVPSIDDVLPDNLLRKAVNGVVHPEWGDAIEKVNAGLNNINDIGILSFSGGLPQSFVPAKLVESTTVLVAHQKVTGAGFGYVSIWPQEQAQKYKYEPDNFLKTSQLKWATFEITDPNFAEREFSANDPNKRQFVC
ncbi:MAG: trypsin-like serine protease, partial [Bdellovibrio sp.]